KPKGVRLQHEALANLLASVRRRPGLTSEDTVVAITTIAFDISLLELLAPLTAGGRVVIASREEAEDPQVLAALLRRHGATVMQATPATWRMLVDDGWAGRTSMRAFCGGERLPRDLAAELLPRVHSLWNLYGPTETCVWSSAAVVRDGATAALVGTPFDNTVILILGRGSVLLPPGFPGEICIGGLGLAEGYQNQPRLTADRFLVHPEYGRLYRTGDRGRLLPSGTLECLGRMDDQVKVRGFRIELGEIETVLAEHPLVDEAAVALVTEDPRGPRITAYAVCRGAELSFAAMRDHLGKSLPAYMVPQQLVVLRALPRLPNGKLDRRLLPKVTSTAAPAIAATALPETPTERIVVDEMRKVLRIERLGVDQDFFDVGGHSLLAAHLVARLNREFDAALTMRAVFELPTPRKLAHAICTGNSRSRASARPVVHRVDQRISPVTHVQDRIWFMERMLAGRPTYNLPSAHRLVGT
ncbi:MAG: AMP-binding protein, partial [Microbacteriaceae bacterium]|nr:AMP-binding protein [Microbacteriaceae bacterium]